MVSRKTNSKAKKPREEEKKGAVIIPFPVVPRRGAEIAGKLPFSVVPTRDAPANKEAPKSSNADARPAAPHAELPQWKWWEVAIAVSIALHLGAAAIFQAKYSYDLERAAGAAAASSEGSEVIPIEVVVTATLPSAPVADATAPDALKPAQTTPQNQTADDKKKSAPPQKNEDAAEVVPTAKETPDPDKEKQDQKKERAQQAKSAAASPSPAAALHNEGRAGAGGRIESGGTANTSSYQAEVLAHLQRYRIYPPEAKSRGITGTAVVRFALASNGSVISASLARGSGASTLDDAALSMVRRASPFPPFPPGFGRSQMDFAAPIRFDLR
ncbi:MAG TPA: TonB family protein [Xanthobacteraceae bacterium]|nr:TonB family protein [Xanthobacteraceae bacterium]